MTMILTADDLLPGDFVTIHRGKREQCPCGCGHFGPEPYERLKGLPLHVAGIQLPYLATIALPMKIAAVRDCELMRVEAEYLAAFVSPAASNEPQQEEACQCPPPNSSP